MLLKDKRIIIAFFLLGMIFGCRNPFSPEETDVVGRVVDSDSNPVSGAAISISPGSKSATTDGQGYYVLTDLRPGAYTITAKKDTYNDKTASVTVESNTGFSCYDPPTVDAPEIEMSSGAGGDSTPPQVSSTYPADGSVVTAEINKVTATFNEAMNPTSIHSSSFRLSYYDSSGSKDVQVAGEVTYSSVNKKALFIPNKSLISGYTFTALLTTDVEDEAKVNMSAEKKWTFRTSYDTTSSTLSGNNKYFLGSGTDATEKFNLSAGTATFILTHDGSSTFKVTLLDAKGTEIEVLINTTGSSYLKKENILIFSTGEYILNIEADGNWNITVEQS